MSSSLSNNNIVAIGGNKAHSPPQDSFQIQSHDVQDDNSGEAKKEAFSAAHTLLESEQPALAAAKGHVVRPTFVTTSTESSEPRRVVDNGGAEAVCGEAAAGGGGSASQPSEAPAFSHNPTTITNAAKPQATKLASPYASSTSFGTLLRESNGKMKELLWYKDRCRDQEAALLIMRERQCVLEEALVSARITVLSEKEHHRVLAALAAEERRESRASLEPQSSAIRAMESEQDGLKRELRRTRMLLERSEEDRTATRDRLTEREVELERLELENEKLRSELQALSGQCRGLKDLYTNITRNVSDSSDDVKGEEIRKNMSRMIREQREEIADMSALMTVLREEKERHELESCASEELLSLFREHMRYMLRKVAGVMVLLEHHGRQLVSALNGTDEPSPSSTTAVHQVEADVIMSFATLLRCAGVVEQQIHMIEGAVGEQLLEATLQQRKVQQLLLAERKAHEEELLDMRRTVKETNEAKLRLEEKLATLDGLYNQLVHAIKCQCRHLLSVTGGGKRGVEGKPASENSQREIDVGEMECEVEGNDEEENAPVEFCECGHDQARAKPRIAAVSKAQRCEGVTLVVPDKSLQALLHRSQEAVKRFVKEVCTTQSASATQLANERQRHQAAVRKLRASLKLTQETVAELQTKLSAAQTECESARRRAEESEAAAQVRAKQNRQLQQDLAAQQRNYEAQRLVAEKCTRDIAALEAQLTGRREEQFEMSVLRGRCDDLMKMITALEQRVQREEKSKFFLYEMIRCCCGALAALSLQLRTTAAERRGMVFAYDGLCEERHSVLLLLQEMKEELEKEDTGSRQVYQPHPVPHGRMYSLFALASTVIASVRMLRLAACRRGKRRVTFEVDSGPVHGSEDNSFKTAHRAFGCPDRLPSSSGLRGVIQNNPVVSALLHRRDLVNVVQKVQIPPLPTLLSHFSSAVGGSAKIECTQLLHYLMDTASLDISRMDCPHYITSHTTDWRGVLLKGAPRLRYREITESSLCTATTKLLREVFFLARCRIGQLKDEQEQGRHAIRRAFAEQCEITAKLHESKHVALSHLQEQHEYETRNAIDQATREVQQELQQRLDDMYVNFQKEREARRKVEEANAILQMREVELLSAAHNMRYEIRSLSMELAEQGQRQRQRPPGERHVSMNATYNCDRSCSGGDGHSFSLYRPRSVQFADDN